jgi:hypothetical protein
MNCIEVAEAMNGLRRKNDAMKTNAGIKKVKKLKTQNWKLQTVFPYFCFT